MLSTFWAYTRCVLKHFKTLRIRKHEHIHRKGELKNVFWLLRIHLVISFVHRFWPSFYCLLPTDFHSALTMQAFFSTTYDSSTSEIGFIQHIQHQYYHLKNTRTSSSSSSFIQSSSVCDRIFFPLCTFPMFMYCLPAHIHEAYRIMYGLVENVLTVK